MAKRKPKIELILLGRCKNDTMVLDQQSRDQMKKFAQQYDGMQFIMTVTAATEQTDKEKCFNYIHGPLMHTVLTLLTHHGYPGLTQSDCYKIMKQRFAAVTWYNPMTKKEEQHTIDFSDTKTTLGQLCDFIDNVVFFIEGELGGTAPDPADFKIKQRLGMTKKHFLGQ